MPENSDEWLKAYRDHEQRCLEAAKLPPGPERDAAYREVAEEFDKLSASPYRAKTVVPSTRDLIFSAIVVAWQRAVGTLPELEQKRWSEWFALPDPRLAPPTSVDVELNELRREWLAEEEATEPRFDPSGRVALHDNIGIAPHLESLNDSASLPQFAERIAESIGTPAQLDSQLHALRKFIDHWTATVREIEGSESRMGAFPVPTATDQGMLVGKKVLPAGWDKWVLSITETSTRGRRLWAELMRRDLLMPLQCLLDLLAEIRAKTESPPTGKKGKGGRHKGKVELSKHERDCIKMAREGKMPREIDEVIMKRANPRRKHKNAKWVGGTASLVIRAARGRGELPKKRQERDS